MKYNIGQLVIGKKHDGNLYLGQIIRVKESEYRIKYSIHWFGFGDEGGYDEQDIGRGIETLDWYEKEKSKIQGRSSL